MKIEDIEHDCPKCCKATEESNVEGIRIFHQDCLGEILKE